MMNETIYSADKETNVIITSSRQAVSYDNAKEIVSPNSATLAEVPNPVDKLKTLFEEVFTTISDISNIGKKRARETEEEIVRRVEQLEMQQVQLNNRLSQMGALESQVTILQTAVQKLEGKLSLLSDQASKLIESNQKSSLPDLRLEEEPEPSVTKMSQRADIPLLTQNRGDFYNGTLSIVDNSSDKRYQNKPNKLKNGKESVTQLKAATRWDAPVEMMTIKELLEQEDLYYCTHIKNGFLSVSDCMALRKKMKSRGEDYRACLQF